MSKRRSQWSISRLMGGISITGVLTLGWFVYERGQEAGHRAQTLAHADSLATLHESRISRLEWRSRRDSSRTAKILHKLHLND